MKIMQLVAGGGFGHRRRALFVLGGLLLFTRLADPQLAIAGDYQRWQEQIGLGPETQQLGQRGRRTLLAVLDTGSALNELVLRSAFSGARSVSLLGDCWCSDTVGHGSAVAGVALGRPNGRGMIGMAPRASLMSVKISGDGTAYFSTIGAGIRHAAQNGADVINLSFGTNAWTPDTLLQPGLAEALQYAAQRSVIVISAGNDGQQKLNALAMHLLLRGVAGSGIIAGSVDGANLASVFTNTPAGSSWDGQAGQDYFLMAPGEGILAPDVRSGPGRTVLWSGTSFSAPAIAGAALLVKAAHPFLTPQQVVSILLRSAQDLGAPGPDGTYGQGLLRVDRALAPVGTQRIATGATVDGPSVPLEASTLSIGRALGALPAVRNALAGGAVFDDYGRDFPADLGAGLSAGDAARALVPMVLRGRTAGVPRVPLPADPRFWAVAAAETEGLPRRDRDPPPIPRLLQDATSGPAVDLPPLAFGGTLGDEIFAFGFGPGAAAALDRAAAPQDALFFTGGSPVAQPLLALAEGGTYGQLGHRFSEALSISTSFALTAPGLTGFGLQDRSQAFAVQSVYRPAEGIALDLTQTWLTEQGGVLGSLSSGALGFGRGSDTVALGLGATIDLPFGLSARISYTEAVTWFAGSDSSLVRAASALRSRALGVSVARAGLLDEDDVLGISVGKPLRVYDGTAELDVPVGRDLAGTVLYRRARVPLAPDGSETDIELAYRRRLGDGILGSLNLVHQEDAGHVRGRQADIAFASVRIAF